MLDLFTKLAAKADADRLKVEAEWVDVVSKVATDRATEKEILNVLKATGRSLANLQSAVEREQRIAELRDIVATETEVRSQLDETATKEVEWNLEVQRKYIADRDTGIAIRTAAYHARVVFANVTDAKRELASLLPPPPIELPELIGKPPTELPDITNGSDHERLADLLELGQELPDLDLVIA